MNSEKNKNIQSIEFLTVAMHFCAILEKSGEIDNSVLTRDLSRILPLLYLKSLLLPQVSDEDESFFPQIVSQEDYEILMSKISGCLKEQDLMVFMPVKDEMEGTYVPLSELLADVYQDLKNFVVNYPLATDDQMDALVNEINQSFKEFWGLKILSCQQSLHKIITDAENIKPAPVRSEDRKTEDWIISRRQKEWGDEDGI